MFSVNSRLRALGGAYVGGDFVMTWTHAAFIQDFGPGDVN